MERGSDKHGPRIDEALSDETLSLRQGGPVESHVQEFKEMEAAGDDEPIPDERVGGGDPTPEGTLSQDEIELRRSIAASLDTTVFPARKVSLIDNARDHMAEPRVISLLEQLPDREYENVQAIWTTLGGPTEERS